MIDEGAVLELVGLIYDAAADAALWPRFLERFADSVRGTLTTLLLYDPDHHAGNIAAAVRIDPADVRRYNDHYVKLDVWGRHSAHRLTPGCVLLGEQLCAPATVAATEFYADFLRPIDTFHMFAGIVSVDQPAISAITSLRPRRDEAFSAHEVRLLESLMPHLRRALALHQRMAGLHAAAASAASVLDALPHGVVLISRSLKILFLNRTAKLILDQRDGLRVHGQELHAHRPEDATRLRQLCRLAVGLDSPCTTGIGGAMHVPRRRSRQPLQVLAAPARTRTSSALAEQTAAVVFITDPEHKHETPLKLLSDLFGLSPAEARLAGELVKGVSLQEASDTLNVSLNTVRTHVKSLFAKTGTRRQAELTRILVASPAQLAAQLADRAPH